MRGAGPLPVHVPLTPGHQLHGHCPLTPSRQRKALWLVAWRAGEASAGPGGAPGAGSWEPAPLALPGEKGHPTAGLRRAPGCRASCARVP